MRFATAGLTAVLTAAGALAQGLGGDAGAVAGGGALNTLRILNQRIPEVTFEEAPFDQVMEWVEQTMQINVQVRWQILEDAGVRRDKPISLRVRNVRFSQVLWMIMNEAGGPDLKLAYRASGNLLILSTVEDLGKEMITRVYDVSDLLVRVPRFVGPRLDLSQQTGAGQGGGGGGQTIFQDEGRDDGRGGRGEGEENVEIENLRQLIIQTVEPETWADNGGQGTIVAFRNQLIVRNSIFVHQRLGGYVEED